MERPGPRCGAGGVGRGDRGLLVLRWLLRFDGLLLGPALSVAEQVLVTGGHPF